MPSPRHSLLDQSTIIDVVSLRNLRLLQLKWLQRTAGRLPLLMAHCKTFCRAFDALLVEPVASRSSTGQCAGRNAAQSVHVCSHTHAHTHTHTHTHIHNIPTAITKCSFIARRPWAAVNAGPDAQVKSGSKFHLAVADTLARMLRTLFCRANTL